MREAYRGAFTPDHLDNGNHQPVDLSLGEEAKGIVRKHAETDPAWKHQELAKQLYGWTDIFRDRLIDPVAIPGKEGKLPAPVIGFQSFDYRTLAYYRLGKNAFGLDDEIILNEVHLDRPLYSILETVLHEQIHLWQQRKGKAPVTRNYHNGEFVAKCESVGLHPELVSGIHTRPADGPFEALMAEYGITKPPQEDIYIVPPGEKRNWWVPPGKERKGRSTLEKWTCPCGQNVRIGKKAFFATCALCHEVFLPQTQEAIEDFIGELEERYEKETDEEMKRLLLGYFTKLIGKQKAAQVDYEEVHPGPATNE